MNVNVVLNGLKGIDPVNGEDFTLFKIGCTLVLEDPNGLLVGVTWSQEVSQGSLF
jgi:hypothetical protein